MVVSYPQPVNQDSPNELVSLMVNRVVLKQPLKLETRRMSRAPWW